LISHKPGNKQFNSSLYHFASDVSIKSLLETWGLCCVSFNLY